MGLRGMFVSCDEGVPITQHINDVRLNVINLELLRWAALKWITTLHSGFSKCGSRFDVQNEKISNIKRIIDEYSNKDGRKFVQPQGVYGDIGPECPIEIFGELVITQLSKPIDNIELSFLQSIGICQWGPHADTFYGYCEHLNICRKHSLMTDKSEDVKELCKCYCSCTSDHIVTKFKLSSLCEIEYINAVYDIITGGLNRYNLIYPVKNINMRSQKTYSLIHSLLYKKVIDQNTAIQSKIVGNSYNATVHLGFIKL